MSEEKDRHSDEDDRPVLPDDAIEDLDPGTDGEDVSGGGTPQFIKDEQGPG